MSDLADVDYIVVGGGLTGCVVASRLTQGDKDGKKPQVALLEAGSDPAGNPAAGGFLSGLSLLGGDYDYAFQTEPVPGTADRVHTLNVGKVLGGAASSTSAAGCVRMQPTTTTGPKRGLKPWLRKTEHFFSGNPDGAAVTADDEQHGSDGPMHVYPVSVGESGIRKYPLREPLGVPSNPRRKNGRNTGLTEIPCTPLDDDGDNAVRIYTNTLVRRVIFSEDGNVKATGVELADGRKIAARKEVTDCAGALRTPQLLMLSGVGPAATLEAHGIPVGRDAPGVGQNLHDQLRAVPGVLPARPLARDPKFSNSPLPWDWVVSQPLPAGITEEKRQDADERNTWEAITMYVLPIPGIPIDGSHIATSTMLLRPTSRGAVTIRSGDPGDAPRIQPNHLSTALDRDTLVHAVRTTLKVMLETSAMKGIVAAESPPAVVGKIGAAAESGEGPEGNDNGADLVPLTADTSPEALEDRIRRTGLAHAHPGGTAAMGKVVDTEGKVLGVRGLRVADASIVPIPLGGHPQATLYAMAEQLASFILGDYSP
ncbi:uncharacterized protein PG986_003546 [Apiospora aurea]|uniref:Glucose-methanol-choline oxidoreductase N-terminal domain-containing protein n=1 Tax=Apiospora aurea TaxID=335848 RepID=A0ABR1QS00_9PEZI